MYTDLLKKEKERWLFNAKICTLIFFLFTPEFKKWKNILYLETDIIVRAGLDALTNIRGFAAVLILPNY